MHGDTIEILPIDYAIVFVWNMGERERLNNEIWILTSSIRF